MARAEVDPENAGKPGHELPPEKEADFQAALARFKAQCDPEKQEVLAAGGLHILGTERHESRRIDNQLRGRAGRQGDPGSSRFFLSLEDDLMRIFGAERITGLMERLGMEEDVPIEHGLINRAIENAQKKVEGHNFDIRKNLLEYDDVMNQQRKAIYALRRQVLEGRYAAEPTEEEKRNGKTLADAASPTQSGKHTREQLIAAVRPTLGRMCDALTQVQTPSTEPGAPPVTTTVPLDPAALRSTIYRQYGAYPDTDGVLENRTETLDELADEIASSMLQQNNRLLDLCDEVLQGILDEHCPPSVHAEEWDLEALSAAIKERFNFQPTIDDKVAMDRDMLADSLWLEIEKIVEARETELSLPVVLYFTRYFYLEEIDGRWIEHLKTMEALREGIGLRGYGQKDPKQEYKKEGFAIFGEMVGVIGRNVCQKVFHMQVQREQPAPQRQRPVRKTVESGGGSPEAQTQGQAAGEDGAKAPIRRTDPKVGRNDPCPCGSGKKYKKCHGAQAA
jgi:preprotein translocase subunit SecA